MKYSKSTRDFIAAVAKEKHMTQEQVIAYLRQILSGAKVSKHSRIFS